MAGVLQLVLGLSSLKGITLLTFIGAVILDYLFAFSVLGFGGIFKGKFGKPALEIGCGFALAGVLRFICHFVSGFLLWGSLLQDGFGAILYSFTYNVGYMAPEIVITVLGGLLICVPLLKTFQQK